MLEILKKLIAIESVSHNEKAVTDWVESQLKTVPGLYERIGNTVVYKNDWQPGRQTIALGAHLDTVPFNTPDWKITQPCQPLVKDEKLYGRGACDMKAGAAIILDLVLTKSLGETYNVLVFFYDREEVGIPNGVTDLINQGYFKDVDFCIIPEPTECRVNWGVFGNLDGRFITTGVAAHSSRPERGDNAIYQLMPVIERLKNYPKSEVHGLSEALSVNIISGGVATNIVPEKAEIAFDYRFDPRRKKSDIETSFKALESDNVAFVCDGMLEGVVHDVAANPLLQQLINLSQDGGVEPFWSDIAQLGQAGVVAVNFGPGSINQAHRSDEFVPLADLQTVRSTLQSFLAA